MRGEMIMTLRRYMRACADMVLPRVCIVCGQKLLIDEKHLCLHCLAGLPLTGNWLVSHNSMADRFNEMIQESYGMSGHGERYAFACALFFYDSEGEYRHIPYNIKYRGDIHTGSYFGMMLGKKMAGAGHFCDIDLVIPVPLHWTRRWKRGYNQAEIIAKAIADEIGAPMRTDILKRTRRTATQTRLDIEGKSRNVSGAFHCTADALPYSDNIHSETCVPTGCGHPGHILLVDDIFTTGSTLHACFSALRSVFPPEVRISVATLGFVGDV